MGSSQRGIFLLKEFCCVCIISCVMPIGFVSMLSFVSLRQSRGAFADGFKKIVYFWVKC